MRNLKIQLTAILRAIFARVYYEDAPDDALFPYIVYSFGASYSNRYNEIVPLDIDVWDNNSSSANVDEIVADLKRNLEGLRYIDDEIQFVLYYDRMLDTDSEDKTLKRKTVSFELRYAERRK